MMHGGAMQPGERVVYPVARIRFMGFSVRPAVYKSSRSPLGVRRLTPRGHVCRAQPFFGAQLAGIATALDQDPKTHERDGGERGPIFLIV